jgi:hypothetical protein
MKMSFPSENSRMNRFDFYTESYYKELEKKDSLEDALNMPLSIASATLAVLFYFSTSYDYALDGWCGCICRITFLLLILVAFTSITIAGHFLTMFYNKGFKFRGYPYNYLRSLSEIDTFYKSLIKYHEERKESVELAKEELEQDLMEQLHTGATANAKLNDTRTEYLHKAKMWLMRSLIPLVISAGLFGYNFYMKDKKEPVHQIEITNNCKKSIPFNVIK